MDAKIYFKPAKQWANYKIEDEEFKRLQGDYSQFLESGSPKGGAYTMASNDYASDTTPKTVLLRFDDITFA